MSTLDLSTLLKPRRTGPPVPVPAVAPPEREQMASRVAQASLDQRGELLRFLSVQDETGGTSEVWTQAGVYPCSIFEVSNPLEAVGVEGVKSTVKYRVRFPRYADVRPEDRFAIPGWFNVWRRSTAVTVGAKAIPEAGRYWLQCIHAGTTGSTAPEVSGEPGVQITDGTVIWQLKGRANFLEITGVNDVESNEEVLVFDAEELS